MKLSKAAAKKHREPLALARSGRRLREEERAFVLDHFHEGAEHMNGLAGAFFTPAGLARDFAIEVPECGRLIDLCAGIGRLAAACDHRAREIVCVERNADYIEVGKATVPDATWICASVFDVDAYAHLGPFDVAISNPPFGMIPAEGFEGKYTGGLFELRLIELASKIARRGVFIVPQASAPFRYSGQRHFERVEDERCQRFLDQTGLEMEMNCGIDTAVYRSEWKGVAPLCEIVVCDFDDDALGRDVPVAEAADPDAIGAGQPGLFEAAE